MKKTAQSDSAESSDTAGSFEESLGILEQAIRALEGEGLPLDESLARYEEGLRAWKHCHKFLEDARQRIETIRRGADGGPETIPMGDDAQA